VVGGNGDVAHVAKPSHWLAGDPPLMGGGSEDGDVRRSVAVVVSRNGDVAHVTPEGRRPLTPDPPLMGGGSPDRDVGGPIAREVVVEDGRPAQGRVDAD